MSIDADFRIEKVANPMHPEPRTAPRPGLDEIVSFLVGRGFSEQEARKIVEKFSEKWYLEHIDEPTPQKFLLWLEGEL